MVSTDALLNLFEDNTVEEWRDSLLEIVRSYGFDQMLFGVVPAKQVSLERSLIITNYSPQWRAQYDANNLHLIDPTVSHCFKSTVPIIWSPEAFKSQSQQEFYEEACRFGLNYGISFPIHGAGGEFGMISLALPEAEFKSNHLRKNRMLCDIALIRDYAFESAKKFLYADILKQQSVALTPRELECLKWVAEGKTSWEASVILACSEATVNFHISNIKRKFGVNTRQQAVVKAINLGLVAPN